jgi:hypothetical protein
LYFDYARRDADFKNAYFNDEDCHVKSEWFVFVRLDRRLWGTENLYYDGHTVKSFTLFGITFGKGYTYDSRPLKDWTAGELARTAHEAAQAHSG